MDSQESLPKLVWEMLFAYLIILVMILMIMRKQYNIHYFLNLLF